MNLFFDNLNKKKSIKKKHQKKEEKIKRYMKHEYLNLCHVSVSNITNQYRGF